MPATRSVSSIMCCALEGGADDQQVVDIKQRVHVVAEQRCWYYGHDACPNSGRAGPPQRLGCMGELDDLMRMHLQKLSMNEVLGPDHRLEHTKILVGCLTLDCCFVEAAESMNEALPGWL